MTTSSRKSICAIQHWWHHPSYQPIRYTTYNPWGLVLAYHQELRQDIAAEFPKNRT